MSTVLSSQSIRAIERGIRTGRCLTVLPDRKGAARVVESDEFLTAEESAAFLKSIAQPTPGTYLDMFIWNFECGSVKRFAAKIGYHPNRISALKSATRGISARLFRCIAEAYKLQESDREFWGKRHSGNLSDRPIQHRYPSPLQNRQGTDFYAASSIAFPSIFFNCGQVRVLATSALVSPPRRACCMPHRIASRPSGRWASVEMTIGMPSSLPPHRPRRPGRAATDGRSVPASCRARGRPASPPPSRFRTASVSTASGRWDGRWPRRADWPGPRSPAR